MTSHRPLVAPALVLFLGILTTSTASLFIRFAQSYASSLVIAAYRLSFAALIVAPVALILKRSELAALTRNELKLSLLSGFFLAVHFATWISSLAFTTVASSVVLVSTIPLWVALLAPYTIKEPIKRLVLMGMLLALAGGAIIGLSDSCTASAQGIACPALREFLQGKAFLGDILALTGAITGAGYLILGRRLRGNMSLLGYIFIVYGMAAAVLVGIMFGARQSPTGYPPQLYVWCLALALGPQLFGHSSFNWALRYLSAAYVSIAMLGEPVSSTILAYFFLHETPSPLKLIGAILILAGISLASQSETSS